MPYTVFLEWYLYWENNRQLMHQKLNEKKKKLQWLTINGTKLKEWDIVYLKAEKIERSMFFLLHFS